MEERGHQVLADWASLWSASLSKGRIRRRRRKKGGRCRDGKFRSAIAISANSDP
jgi:hypothetical protein